MTKEQGQKVTIEAVIQNERMVQKFPYGELNEEHCIHGIKLRWSCDECEDYDPDEITDTQRLDWLIENRATIAVENKKFAVVSDCRYKSSYMRSAREAIDAAIRGGE